MTQEADRQDERGSPPAELNAAFLLIAVGRRLREQAESRLRDRGLSMRHLAALGHLGNDPGCSYSELARRAGITAQSMQATLRQLEELGAVERRTAPGRGRAARLHVTEVGESLSAWGRTVLRELDDELLAALPDELRSGFTAALLSAFTTTSLRGESPDPA